MTLLCRLFLIISLSCFVNSQALAAPSTSQKQSKPAKTTAKAGKSDKGKKPSQPKVSRKAAAPAQAPAVKHAAAPDKKSETDIGLGSLQGQSDEPVYINSDSLNVNGESRVFHYTGHVQVKQGDLTLTSDQLEGHYDENNQIQQLIARKNVTVNKGPDIKASSQLAVYEKASDIIVLTENPQIEQKGSWLSADTIKVFLKENRSQAEGNVRMKLDEKAAPKGLSSEFGR